MAKDFQLVDIDFGADVNAEIAAYVEQQLEWLIQAHRELHESRIPKWRKLYLGEPAEKSRNFPFMNAANTVVQVIGETVDTMTARVMGLIWATHPLWVFQSYEKAANDGEKRANEERKRVLEDFMDLVGFEPYQLDLQRVEAELFTDAAKLGTAFAVMTLEDQVEAIVVGYDSGSSKRIKAQENTIYRGPKVSKPRHEDILADPAARTLDEAEFVAKRRTLKRRALMERMFTGAYKKEAVEAILSSPDRSTPTQQVKQELQGQGIASPAHPDSTAEWDIYECYFAWWAGNPKRKFRVIYTYHKKSKTVLRKVFNFLPDNELPIKRAKRGYNTDGLYGHGYAELLEIYQEELSTTHNQRIDNATVANVRALRVSPRARALDSNIELYPSALIVGEKDEIESIQVGDVYPSTFKNEEMTLGLVARRAGISPAVSGAGTGGIMKGKGSNYSAQGTLAVMQENNSVVGFATSDFRNFHVQLGHSLVKLFGKFGTDGKEQMFGLDGKRLTEALERFNRGTMAIPVRAATGGLNREVEKQTGMLMAGLLQRHYTAVGQLLQALGNPMIPAEVKDYFIKVVLASEMFHKKVVHDFGYEQPDLFVPEARVAGGGQPQAPGPMGQGGMAPGGPPVEGASQLPAGGGGQAAPIGGMGPGSGGGPGAAR